MESTTVAKPQRGALLLQLMDHLGRIKVREKYLPRTAGCRVFGYTYADGSIEVNPVNDVVDTVIHELLHSLHPEYSERTVKRLTTSVVSRMSDDETLAFYATFQARVA